MTEPLLPNYLQPSWEGSPSSPSGTMSLPHKHSGADEINLNGFSDFMSIRDAIERAYQQGFEHGQYHVASAVKRALP